MRIKKFVAYGITCEFLIGLFTVFSEEEAFKEV